MGAGSFLLPTILPGVPLLAVLSHIILSFAGQAGMYGDGVRSARIFGCLS